MTEEPGDPMDKRSPWGHKESDMTEQLSMHTRVYVIALLFTICGYK